DFADPDPHLIAYIRVWRWLAAQVPELNQI
ncbi:hypothetical protein BMETH_1507585675561, partial [methanotrophic bacterial endosymbiont of Bathymodiolus sp.]